MGVFVSVTLVVQLVDVVVTKPFAYGAIPKENDRRVKDGCSLSPAKPKRTHSVDSEELEVDKKYSCVV